MAIKSRAISRVNLLKITDVSDHLCLYIIRVSYSFYKHVGFAIAQAVFRRVVLLHDRQQNKLQINKPILL
jgi:hypothetical protein